MWHSGWSTGDWILISAGVLVFWTLVVAGALAAWVSVRRAATADTSTGRPGPRRAAGADARAILDERLARGDLTPEDYKARRELIGPS